MQHLCSSYSSEIRIVHLSSCRFQGVRTTVWSPGKSSLIRSPCPLGSLGCVWLLSVPLEKSQPPELELQTAQPSPAPFRSPLPPPPFLGGGAMGPCSMLSDAKAHVYASVPSSVWSHSNSNCSTKKIHSLNLFILYHYFFLLQVVCCVKVRKMRKYVTDNERLPLISFPRNSHD